MRRPRLWPADPFRFEYGTVAYHRAQVVWWRRSIQVNAACVFANAVVAVYLPEWWLRPVPLVGVTFAAMGVQRARTQQAENALKAWATEAQQTVAGMHASGLYTLSDAVRALGEGDPPPGVEAPEWRAMHEQLAERIDRGDL